MKKSAELLGLPIISILEGNHIGTVKGLIINPTQLSVDFLTIEQEEWQISLKAVPFKKVIGAGEYAVMIEQDKSVIDLNELPFVNQLLSQKFHLIGSKVLTKKGELLGEVSEYVINEETGQLDGLCLNSSKNEILVPIENVISLGKEHVIVSEYESDSFLNKSDSPSQVEVEKKKSESPQVKEVETKSLKKSIEQLKAKQMELLKGKVVTKDIYNKSGILLLAKGTVLTEDHILAVEKEGASTFVELSMNVKE